MTHNNALTSAALAQISANLKTLTSISRDNGPISYSMPDAITYRNGDDNEIIGSAAYDRDLDEWVFRPLPNIPPPPTF